MDEASPWGMHVSYQNKGKELRVGLQEDRENEINIGGEETVMQDAASGNDEGEWEDAEPSSALVRLGKLANKKGDAWEFYSKDDTTSPAEFAWMGWMKQVETRSSDALKWGWHSPPPPRSSAITNLECWVYDDNRPPDKKASKMKKYWLRDWLVKHSPRRGNQFPRSGLKLLHRQVAHDEEPFPERVFAELNQKSWLATNLQACHVS